MRTKRTVTTLALLAALGAGAFVYALRQRPEPPAREARPAPDAPPAPSPEAAPPASGSVPSPADGERAEIAPAEPPPVEPRPSPRPRRERARPPARPDPRVEARSSAPRLGDYLDAVAAEVGGRWKMPKPAGPTVKTVPVLLKIARDGRVLWTLVGGSAGDAATDASIKSMIETLEREGLPPLPAGYPYDELDVGLVLNPAALR